MFPTWMTVIATSLMFATAAEDITNTGAQQNPQSLGGSNIWIQKMKTYFHVLDFDGDGIVCRDDFDAMANRYADLENFSQEERRTALERIRDLYSLYTAAAGSNPDVVMTESILIESVGMQRDDPAFKKILDDALLSLLTPTKVVESGELNYDEFGRIFRNLGFVYTNFIQAGFAAIDNDHDGRVSFKEYLDASNVYMCSNEVNSAELFGTSF